MQAKAVVAGAHDLAAEPAIEHCLALGSEAVLLSLSDKEDTVRALEDILLRDYGFPEQGLALLAVDYLNRVPVVGLTGMLAESTRGGEAAAMLRELSRRHSWATIAAAALKSDSFTEGDELSALLGDERVPYEADRVLLMRPAESLGSCGCISLNVHTLKDRTGPAHTWKMHFWGARFYPALPDEFQRHD